MSIYKKFSVGNVCFGISAVTIVFVFGFGVVQAKVRSAQNHSEFQKNVEQAILDNPEVILIALKKLDNERKSQKAAEEKLLISENYNSLIDEKYSWISGNVDGDITVVEFVDYKCGYCKKASPEVKKLLENDPNIKLVIKEYPILGSESFYAAQIAVSTLLNIGSEAYNSVHHELMSFNGPINPASMKMMLKKLKLDYDTIQTKSSSDAVNEYLLNNKRIGQKFEITGTPGFLINDKIIRGYMSPDNMTKIIDDFRNKSG